MANILDTSPQDWKYVSEGGATIVFSYAGPARSDFDGTVLRLRKAELSAARALNEQDSTDPADEPDDPTIEYQKKCMERLIPPEHLPRMESIRLDRAWLEALAQLHDSARPEGRRAKDAIDLARKKGVLATDLVGGHWLAVEIKPKWAFLPSPVYLSDETKSVKTQTCRFCMHSHMRRQSGEQELTEYCPLDLFSGEEDRILKAIHDLWNGWVASNATINNLKIFAAGKLVTPSESRRMLSDEQAAGMEMDDIRDAFAASLSKALLQTPVLRILSRLQRGLDALDIEGLSQLWKRTESAINAQSAQGSESAPSYTPLGGQSPFFDAADPDISEWITFIETYTSADKPRHTDLVPSPEALRYHLLAYLLSATFKDCSVIVKLGFLGSSAGSAARPGSVTIIDLDPKKMSKLKGWEKLDAEIVRAYASAADARKTCVDVWDGAGSISS